MKKIIISILVLAVLLSSYSSKINNEKPISNSYEELDKLPQEYPSKLAQENGDVVNTGGIYYNVEKLDKFIEASKDNKANESKMVRITTYTDEGDAIIYDVIRNSEGLKLIIDYTRDKFSSREARVKREFKVTKILKKSGNQGVSYVAIEDNEVEIPLLR